MQFYVVDFDSASRERSLTNLTVTPRGAWGVLIHTCVFDQLVIPASWLVAIWNAHILYRPRRQSRRSDDHNYKGRDLTCSFFFFSYRDVISSEHYTRAKACLTRAFFVLYATPGDCAIMVWVCPTARPVHYRARILGHHRTNEIARDRTLRVYVRRARTVSHGPSQRDTATDHMFSSRL